MGNRKLLAAALVLPSLLALTIAGAASAQDANNGGRSNGLNDGPQTLGVTIDAGWQFFNDCAIGTACPDGPFTFTAPTGGACVSVTDVFLKADQYSLTEGGSAIGTTSAPFPDDATNQGDPDLAFADPEFSSGRWMVEAGARSIDVTRVAGVTSLAAAYIRVDSPGTAFCAPNLEATSFSGPTLADLNEAIGSQISVTMTNTGNADFAPGYSSSIGFYVSADSTIDIGDTLLIGGRENIGQTFQLPNGLAAGATWTDFLVGSGTIPASSPQGNVFIGFVVDEFDTVAESDESVGDNTKSQAILIDPKPDLVISSFTHVPASPTTADPITITATVKNVGTAAAGSSTGCIDVGGETCASPSTEMLYAVPGLAIGETFDMVRPVTLEVAQGYINNAEADLYNVVDESDEGNNTASDSFTVSEEGEPVGTAYSVLTLPSNGTLFDSTGTEIISAGQAIPDTRLTYEPDAGFTGTDSFTYRCTDLATGLFDDATVDIIVSAPPGSGVTLTVDFQGAGSGDVAMDIAGSVVAICSADCVENFGPGDVVKLQARPVDLSSFNSWGGACSIGGSSQIVTITLPATGNTTCTATFDP